MLSGRRLAVNELGAEIAKRIARKLLKRQRDIWEGEGPYAPDQPLGEGVVHFCIRIVTLQRGVCLAPRAGNKAPFVLVDEWLGHPIPDIDPAVAPAELLRRYLRCYGPSRRGDFAAWAGIRARDTDPWWSLVEDELTQVEYGGTSWILAEDLDALRSAPTPKGVRLLPPRDPYTQVRDRETIIDKKYHRDGRRSATGHGPPRRRDHRHMAPAQERRAVDHHRKDVRLITRSGQEVAAERGRAGRAVAGRASSVAVEFDTY